ANLDERVLNGFALATAARKRRNADRVSPGFSLGSKHNRVTLHVHLLEQVQELVGGQPRLLEYAPQRAVFHIPAVNRDRHLARFGCVCHMRMATGLTRDLPAVSSERS